MSLINPCNLSLAASNTGVECQASMAATAMLILVPSNATFTEADIVSAGSFTDLISTKAHLPAASRWYPVFGFAAPINSITESNESDVIETLDDGSQIFVRYGKYNRTFLTTSGGLCLAEHLMRFPKGYAFIEVDIEGKVLAYEKSEGVYAGIPVSLMKGMAPELANLKTSFKNKLMLSFDPVAYVQQGKIFASDSTENILGAAGLLDTVLTASTTTQTTTNIYFGVKTKCAETDLVELYPSEIDTISNYVVKNASGGTITPSACVVLNGEIKLTGTYASGTNITVQLAAPATLKTNGIEGYEGVNVLTIAIP